MKLVEQYGTPLKFTYLQISNNIKKRAKTGVNRKKTNMKVNIITVIARNSHFEYIMNEAFKTTSTLKPLLLLTSIL
jgi:arginine decarboxylase